ncbi:MAG: SUMF1/EgtB/PvdO family nonheme iron enzyme, partial [Myxococcota bacterium]|nr:SUMF1/EgtB/PvdO family nonheme iron enzyme [Myxococcota bacterium]
MFLILSFLLLAEPKKEEAVKPKPIKVFKSEMGYETVLVDVTPFTMGERQGTLLQDDDERPFDVQLTHSFYMGQKEVSRGFWRSVMGNDPNAREGGACLRSGTYDFPDNDSPVYCVDWFEAVEFANQLSKWEGFEQCYIISGNQVQYPKGYTCKGYRLPTEAEW